MTTEQKVIRKLRAILSADVKGYSLLMTEDEAHTIKTLKEYRNIMSGIITQHSGRVVDAPGDNIMAEFSSVVNAVQCSVEIQNELKNRNAELPDDKRLVFRIGVNIGDVVQDGDSLYGEGVNIAARIEGLADPGGVCISRNAYGHIRNKLNFGYEYLGDHSVKNIKHPVRVYKVLMEPEDAGKLIGEEPKPLRKSMAWATIIVAAIILIGYQFFQKPADSELKLASIEKMTDPAPEEPSIAVLPFDNMSKDPEQEYFSNGISENLITDLSKVPNFLVISRNTSFSYKGKSLTIEQIAKELDVRYVLEGSVQKANNIVRINVQLIDATTGHHVWAERYDGNTSDIFALQDKITQKITASLAMKLTEDEQDRLTQKDTNNIEAYEAFLKGLDFANYTRMDPEGFIKSIPWFEKAIKLDPDYSRAYAALAESYWRGAIVGIHKKLGISSRLARLRAINYLHISMKNPTNIAYRTLARVYTAQRQHEKATDYAMKAIALDPNDPDSNAIMASTLISSGRPDEAIYFVERMRRTDPACLF
jgi:adenylate cyclase